MLKPMIGSLLLACILLHAGHISIALASCGDGITQSLSGEECDDGGTCIGGTNAGTHCVAETDCLGNGVCLAGLRTAVACASDADCPDSRCAHCVPFGGDGCAANCTVEHDVAFNLVPGVRQGQDVVLGTSGSVINSDILTIPLPLGGNETAKIGADRGDGIIPVVIKVPALGPSIPISTLACACIRQVAVKTCGGTLLDRDGITASPDCTLNDAVCAGKPPCTFLHGDGNAGSGVVSCGGSPLAGVNVTVMQDAGGSAGISQPAIVTRSGSGDAGSAAVLLSTALGITVGLCSGTDPTIYGADGQFCTGDDPIALRGAPTTNYFVTGMASATVSNVGGLDGETVGPFSAAGQPFSCSALTQRGDTNGACLAAAFTVLNQPSIGDVAITTMLCSQGATISTPTSTPTAPTPTPAPMPANCVGDCNADGVVTIDEIIRLVALTLGVSTNLCPGAMCTDQGPPVFFVDCVIEAINNALTDCPGVVIPSPTPTPTICFESVGGCCDFGGRRPCYDLREGDDAARCEHTDAGSPVGCAGSVTCNQATGLCESAKSTTTPTFTPLLGP